MQVFNTFWKIAIRRLPSIIMYVVIYAVVTILVGSLTSSMNEDQYSDTNINICIMDEDNSDLSKGLTEYVTENNTVVSLENDKEVMQDALFFRNVDYILQIPSGFEESFVNNGDLELTNIKIPSGSAGVFTDNKINSFLSTVKMYLAGGSDINSASSKAIEACSDKTEVTVKNFATVINPNSNLAFFFEYMPYALLMILLSGLCPILITMNSKEVSNRTACSSLTRKSRSLQLALSSTLYGGGVWLIFIIFAVIVYGGELFTIDGARYVLNSLVFLVVTASLSILVSSFNLQIGAVSIIANAVGLGMCFLCGVFVPQWLLGEQLLNAAKFLPAYWYIRAVNMLGALGNEPFTVSEYNICIFIQILFAVLLFAVGFVVSKRKKS